MFPIVVHSSWACFRVHFQLHLRRYSVQITFEFFCKNPSTAIYLDTYFSSQDLLYDLQTISVHIIVILVAKDCRKRLVLKSKSSVNSKNSAQQYICIELLRYSPKIYFRVSKHTYTLCENTQQGILLGVNKCAMLIQRQIRTLPNFIFCKSSSSLELHCGIFSKHSFVQRKL